MALPDWFTTQTETHPIPDTAEALVVRWASRDNEYAKRTAPMMEDQIASIRSGRMREANLLPNVTERAAMWGRAMAWMPPPRADYGGLHSWIEDD